MLLASVLFICASSFTPATSVLPPTKDTTSKIEVRFNHQLRFNDLAQIKSTMAKKGLNLEYKYLKFDEEGKLVAISFSVDCNNGMRGSAENDQVLDNSTIGFYRDYNKGAKSPFGLRDY